VIVINKELKKYTMELGANPAKVSIIGAGVDLKRINPFVSGEEVRESFGISKSDFVMFFMGWLYNFSGLKEVASTMLSMESGQLRLLALGNGELLPELEKLKGQGIEGKIILVPWRPYEEIPKFLASADVCLLPSHNNDVMKNIVPIKMYEYLAAGKPVIASRLPGLVREFGDSSGVVYIDRPEDAVRIALKLAESPELTKSLSSKAVAFVSERSWDVLVTNFENLLQGLVPGRSHVEYANIPSEDMRSRA
jgi:glycosyltransferase involved in cell wall biosynthesis